MNKMSHHILCFGFLSVFITLGFSTDGAAQNLRLTPPKINYESCIKPNPPLDDLANQLKSSPVSGTNISDANLITLANLFKNGSAKTISDISKTVEIIEYLIAKKTIKPLLKARALKIKAQLMYAGEGYTENKNEAKKILRDVIQNTDPTATLNLAKMLEVEGQFTEAEAMYKKSLADKDPVAALALAYMYHNKDIIVPQETTDSYVILAQNMLLEKLALGQCDYFGKIGFMYMNLRGLPDNEQLAAEWLLVASRFDHARSKQQLASFIAKGYLSDIENKPSVENLLKQAAELGSADAMYDLGLSLFNRDETKAQAIAWFEKSGERHNIAAIEKLIQYYKSLSSDDYLYWLNKMAQYDEIDPELLVEYANALLSQADSDPKKIYALYERAGRLGNDEALFQMGEAHKFGIGVEKNPVKALRFYRLAAQNTNLDAFEAIIESYECGIGKNKNNDIANKWTIRGEYHGLETIYDKMVLDFQKTDDKDGVIESYLPSITKISRDKKSARAMVRLGVMYDFLGNKKQSKKWFNRAFAMKNVDEAYYHYARELKEGGITKQDLEKSNHYMTMAADKNNAAALKRLGQNLEKQKQYADARVFFEKSYQLGDQSSASKIAAMDLKLGNTDRAIGYLKKAANNNDAGTMFDLAKLYSETNPDLASQWFTRAEQNYICDTGDILEIAESYLDGKNGAPKNLEKAEKWLGRISTIETLSDNDQINYAELIINSETFKTRPEYKMAMDQLAILATQNNKKALSLLSDHHLQTTKDKDKAIQWLTKSAENNNTDAMVKLGRLYLSGYMVDQSTNKARQWLKKAADLKNQDAIKYLKTIDILD